MTPVLPRPVRTALCAAALLLGACQEPAAPRGEETTPLIVRAELNQQPIATLTLEVTGVGIPVTLVFNLQIANGVAAGTVNVPVGPARTFIARAFDATGLETHTGQVTMDVRPGMNTTLPIRLVPRAGGVPLTVSLGTVALTVTPPTATIAAGQTVQLTATATDGQGNPLTLTVTWATSNAAHATVDQTGLVTGVLGGQVQIVATADGAAASATVTVTGGTPAATQWSGVTLGNGHTCALTAVGFAYCWGNNSNGQLGDGTRTNRLIPTLVASAPAFRLLVAGDLHTCGVATNNAVYCWGANAFGQVDASGTGQPDRLVPTPIPGTESVAWDAVAAGASHTCASQAGAGAVCWGSDATGQLGDGATISTGTIGTVANGLSFAMLSAGSGHTCGVTGPGVLYCWGANSWGQLNDGGTNQQNSPVGTIASASGAIALSLGAGDDHTCGVFTGAGMRISGCWGRNDNGQLGDGTTNTGAAQIGVGDTFATITAGGAHSCAITNVGAVTCWGLNASGQLGDGTQQTRLAPVTVSGGLTFTSADAGKFHTCGVATGGALYCWGSNGTGGVGDGTLVSRAVPTRVVEP